MHVSFLLGGGPCDLNGSGQTRQVCMHACAHVCARVAVVYVCMRACMHVYMCGCSVCVHAWCSVVYSAVHHATHRVKVINISLVPMPISGHHYSTAITVDSVVACSVEENKHVKWRWAIIINYTNHTKR